MAMKSLWLTIEIVGPPGVGKTTLTSALKQRDSVLAGAFPDVQDVKNLPFFVGNSLVSLPLLPSIFRKKDERGLIFQEWAYMTILNGWPQVLERQPIKEGNVMILDQGPVYMLTELLRYNPQLLSNRVARAWWESVCKQWVYTLDLVICLDAQDKTLIERIRKREKLHGIKANSNQWAIQFLAEYRSAQAKVLSGLMKHNKNYPVFSFETSEIPVEETSAGILDLVKKVCAEKCPH